MNAADRNMDTVLFVGLYFLFHGHQKTSCHIIDVTSAEAEVIFTKLEIQTIMTFVTSVCWTVYFPSTLYVPLHNLLLHVECLQFGEISSKSHLLHECKYIMVGSPMEPSHLTKHNCTDCLSSL